jgi:hypothetical protein
MIELVPALVRDDPSAEVSAQQRQIADQVGELVPHVLVGEAKFVFDGPVLSHHQHVARGEVLPHALGLELRGFALQQEGPRGGDLPHVVVFAQPEAEHLPAYAGDAGVVQIVEDVQAVDGPGHGNEHGVALADGDGFFDDVDLLRNLLLDDSRVEHRVGEGFGRSVRRGRFRGGHVDLEVVQVQSPGGRQHVLDRFDARDAVHQHGASRLGGHVGDVGGDADRFGKVGADKHDAAVGLARA